MTEQQIDAEVSRYEPLHACGLRGTWSWWLFSELIPTYAGDRSDLPEAIFERLATGKECTAEYARYYPTREAGFADLRQAIAQQHASA